MILFYSNFATMGKGLLSGLFWMDGVPVGVPEAGIYFQVVWFLGSHFSSPLAASTSTASWLGLKLLKPGSPGTVTPLHAAGFQQTGEKLLDHSLPCLGLELLHCVRCSWSRLSEGPPASRRKF